VGQRLDLELTADPADARSLRAELQEWLLEAGINGAAGHDIVLGAVEAFTNSVRHPVERATPRIAVHGVIDSSGVTVMVEDDGRWRQPDRSRDSGGFGLALMKSFMTSVRIERTELGTRVVLQRLLA
jgi:anti-sigma regulatory factor (Ser/Thr protein kinase)